VAAASYLACIAAARLAGRAITRLNYRLLCLGVLLFLVAMTYTFTGLFGLFIFFLSTVVGLIAPVAGIHRTNDAKCLHGWMYRISGKFIFI